MHLWPDWMLGRYPYGGGGGGNYDYHARKKPLIQLKSINIQDYDRKVIVKVLEVRDGTQEILFTEDKK